MLAWCRYRTRHPWAGWVRNEEKGGEGGEGRRPVECLGGRAEVPSLSRSLLSCACVLCMHVCGSWTYSAALQCAMVEVKVTWDFCGLSDFTRVPTSTFDFGSHGQFFCVLKFRMRGCRWQLLEASEKCCTREGNL